MLIDRRKAMVIGTVVVLSVIYGSGVDVVFAQSCAGNSYDQQMPVAGVQLPSVNIESVSALTVKEGETIFLTASASVDAQRGGIASFLWCTEEGTLKVDLTYSANQNQSRVEFTAPLISGYEATVRIFVQVGDSLGYVAKKMIPIRVISQKEPVFTIEGYSMDEYGLPLSGVEVTAVGENPVYSDREGHYQITGLSDLRYTLFAYKAGYDFTPSAMSVKLYSQFPQANIDFIGNKITFSDVPNVLPDNPNNPNPPANPPAVPEPGTLILMGIGLLGLLGHGLRRGQKRK